MREPERSGDIIQWEHEEALDRIRDVLEGRLQPAALRRRCLCMQWADHRGTPTVAKKAWGILADYAGNPEGVWEELEALYRAYR